MISSKNALRRASRAWLRNFRRSQESVTLRLLLYFVNVEGHHCVGLEYVPQLSILDLCQEAEMLLYRFEASLKAGITRGGLPIFLFSFSITMTSQPPSIGPEQISSKNDF